MANRISHFFSSVYNGIGDLYTAFGDSQTNTIFGEIMIPTIDMAVNPNIPKLPTIQSSYAYATEEVDDQNLAASQRLLVEAKKAADQLQQKKEQEEIAQIKKKNSERISSLAAMLKGSQATLSTIKSVEDYERFAKILQKAQDEYIQLQDVNKSDDYKTLKSFDDTFKPQYATSSKTVHNSPSTENFPDGSRKDYDGKGNFKLTNKDGQSSEWTPEGQNPVIAGVETPIKHGPVLDDRTQNPGYKSVPYDKGTMNYDGKGFYQWIDSNGHTEGWIPLNTSPEDWVKNGYQVKATEGAPPPTQPALKANEYREPNGSTVMDSTPIPAVLQGGKIKPYQYFQQNGLNWERDAKRIAEEAGIKDYTGVMPGQNYALVEYLEQKKQGGTTPTTSTTSETQPKGTPGDWIEPAKKTIGGEFTKEQAPANIPSRFSDKEGLANYTPELRNQRIGELDIASVKSELQKAIDSKNVSMINQILGTNFQQPLLANEGTELPGILSAAQKAMATLTPEQATKYMNSKNDSFAEINRTNDVKQGLEKPDELNRIDQGRQNILEDIALNPDTEKTKYNTVISDNERNWIKQRQQENEGMQKRNKIKDEMNYWKTQYSNALSQSPEQAKTIKDQWKSVIQSYKRTGELTPEIENDLKNDIATKKVRETTLGVSGKPQPATQEPKQPKVPEPKLPIEYSAPKKYSMELPVSPTVDSFANQNSGNTPTRVEKIEKSFNPVDEPQTVGMEKNIFRRS